MIDILDFSHIENCNSDFSRYGEGTIMNEVFGVVFVGLKMEFDGASDEF